MEAERPKSSEQTREEPAPAPPAAAPGQWFFEEQPADQPAAEEAGAAGGGTARQEVTQEGRGDQDNQGNQEESAEGPEQSTTERASQQGTEGEEKDGSGRDTESVHSSEGESKAQDGTAGTVSTHADGETPAFTAAPATEEDSEDNWLAGLAPPPPATKDLGELRMPSLDEDLSEDDADAGNIHNFTSEVKAEEIIVGLVPEEEIKRREQALEEERVRAAQEKARKYAAEQQRLLEMENAARNRIEHFEKDTSEKLRQRASALNANVANRETGIRRVFERAKEELRETLKKQKAIVYEKYGKLEQGRAGAKELRIEWDRLPQPLQIQLELMKAVKDKLPNGRYSVLATLYDRLGGAPMHWTKLRNDQGGTGEWRPTASPPFRHRGRFYDTEARIDENVYVTVPPERDVRPSNVVIFELFQLGNRRRPVDRVVAWTALPICDPNFRAVQGRFVLPLLRGEVDFNIVRFVSMERRISRDLDSWLCNLYLDVRHLPREVVVNNTLYKEYDVEVAYTSEMLRLRGEGRNVELLHNEEDSANQEKGGQAQTHTVDLDEEIDEWESDEELWDEDAAGVPVVVPGGVGRDKQGRVKGMKKGYMPLPTEEEPRSTKRTMKQSAFFESSPASEREFWAQSSPHGSPGSDAGRQQRTMQIEGISTKSPSARAGAVAQSGAERFRNHRNLRLGVGLTAVPETKEVEQTEEKGNDPGPSFQRPEVKETLEEGSSVAAEYSYAVTRQKLRGMRGRRVKESKRKMRFLRHEMISDLRLSHWKSFDFWVQLVLLLLAFWSRLYMHYIGQYVFLQMLRVPVYNFEATWYNCIVKYVAQVIPMEYELGVIMAGMSTNILLFCVFMFTSWLSLAMLGTFPETLSRFVAGFGFFTVLDPLLIFLVDLMSSNWNCQSFAECAGDIANPACRCSEGDAFKLYYRFKSSEGSGVIGIVLTVFVYIVLFLIACFFLYVFLLNLYLNGRMLDVYRRIYADENTFTLPGDNEVSPAELQWVLMKAKRWRGPKGTSRKIAVCDYILTDPLDSNFREVTTHVVIYHATLDGSRELYRHFLRLPDGAIVEVFGNMEQLFGMQSSALDDVLTKKDKTKDEDVSRFFSDLVKSTQLH